jgi:hypothetical protein
VSETRISRQELAAVAVALLLPIPLLAATGLRFALPAAIERGVASLQLGGGSDAAVVGAAAAPTSEPPVATPQGAGPAPATEEDSPAVGSTRPPTAAGAGSARDETRDKTPDDTPDETSPEADPPTAPNPHTDDTVPPGESDGGEPLSEEAAAPAEPGETSGIQAAVTVESDAAVASVEIAVTDGGVTVDTGGDADLGPPLVVPIALPDLPLP